MNKCAFAFVVLLAAGAAAAESPQSARDTIVRGNRKLSAVLAAATLDAWQDRSSIRPVAVVVDVTPYTALAEPAIRKALDDVGGSIPHLEGSWTIGRLGGELCDPVRHPSALIVEVAGALAERTRHVNTLAALQRTLSGFRERNGVIVYLADWQFEDDQGIEQFITGLRSLGQSLRVIGSESCFNRAWNDGFYPPDWGAPGPQGRKRYAEGIGRSPFGPEDPRAPWHGGDTAWPHFPPRYRGPHWQMEFGARVEEDADIIRRYAEELKRLGRPGDPEDLAKRLKEEIDSKREDRYYFPVSSSFGPYALMRAAAATGGKYWLYSWNPTGRTDLVYDYSRCNLFPPDLRSRKAILAEIPGRPLAMALLRAWHTLANRSVRIADVTAPLSENGRVPQTMKYAEGGRGLGFSWPGTEDHKMFLAQAKVSIAAMDRALAILRNALGPARPKDDVDARYRADAELFKHIVLVHRFELMEAYAAALEATEELWSDPKLIPGLDPEYYIHAGRDPEFIPVTQAKLFHPEEGRKLVPARSDHLRKYLGTPFGEIVARNPVMTYRLIRRPIAPGIPAKRTPSESGDKQQPTPGGSGGGGPSTGR